MSEILTVSQPSRKIISKASEASEAAIFLLLFIRPPWQQATRIVPWLDFPGTAISEVCGDKCPGLRADCT